MNEIEQKVDSIIYPKRRRKGLGVKKRSLIMGMVVLVSIALVASGALLAYYGKVTTTANVSQSVMIDGKPYTETISHTLDITAGCTEIYKHKIKNNACVEAPIKITTAGVVGGVNVNYYIMDGQKTLRLENKNPSDWAEITDDNIYASVTFNPCCPTFTGTVEVHGLATDTKYALIYYADQQDRYDNWGGDPLEVITTFTGDGTYTFNKALANKCLPMEGDWNIGPDAEYTATPDFYVHGKGAKLWIVPFDDIAGIKDNTVWNPSSYLFETDLIGYFDCDVNPIPAYLQPYFGYETVAPSTYPLQPGEEICLFISYNFDVAIIPGQYTLTTTVEPQ